MANAPLGKRSTLGPVTSLVSTTAIQLLDLSSDYWVYLEATTAGTGFSLSIGPTSSANLLTIQASSTATLGQLVTFLLPAGWYFKPTFTTAAFQYTAVSA